MALQTCWELKECGRCPGGAQTKEHGVCPAYPMHGHSCWMVAGTFCGGRVQGSFATKLASCMLCDVYKKYNPVSGSLASALEHEHPEEFHETATRLRSYIKSR